MAARSIESSSGSDVMPPVNETLEFDEDTLKGTKTSLTGVVPLGSVYVLKKKNNGFRINYHSSVPKLSISVSSLHHNLNFIESVKVLAD